MVLWNKVVCGFDRDEETVNFGARAVAEKDGSVFETCTLATVQADGEVIGRPNISASVQCNRICIAVDNSITIFEDETCEVILLNVNFGCPVSEYCVSDDGSFLFVVLTSGVLHCSHLTAGGRILFSKNVITDSTCKIIKMFVTKDKLGNISIALITTNGSIYSVSGIDTAKLQAPAITVDDVALLKDIDADVHCSQVHKGFINDEVVYANARIVHDELEIALACTNSLFMWPSKKRCHYRGLPYTYTKILFLRCYDAMLCLRSDNKLNLVCARTLLGLKAYDECIDDFIIIGDENTDSCQVLMLSKSEKNDVHYLRLVSFPDFTEKIQITVSGFIRLIEITDHSDGGILFMECVDSTNRGNSIDTIRVKTISESIPEYQLERLVRRGLFDAAEQFARKYNLSTESIYCSKAALFMTQLGPWAKQGSNTIELDKFIAMLDKIENIQYVVECCSKALVVDYKLMRELHFYARKRIIASNEKVKSNEHLNLLHSINSTLHKLETCNMIYGWQKKNCLDDESILKEWIRFSRANIMEEYKMHLRMGEPHNFEAAALIWTRHLSGTEIKLSQKFVQEIFAIIPKGINPSTLWSWLSHFVPSLLSVLPDSINEVVLWGYSKTKSLEHSHRSAWPQIGIEFVEKFTKLLQFEENSQCVSIHQEYSNQNSTLKRFILLMQALSDIQKLKLNYRLTIMLDAYSGEPMEVCHTLLNRIHVDAIPGFVETFLKQYILNNSLQIDTVFSSYIKKLISNSRNWWSREEAAWEKKAVTVIALIQDIESKLTQTLQVLRKAPVPWSSTIKTLAETSSNIDHTLVSEIRIECNYVPMKLILKRYGYEIDGINERLMYIIIKENDADMVTHLDQLTENDRMKKQNAFSCCVNYHLTRGNLKTVMKVLDHLEEDILLHCCLRIVNWVIASLGLKDTFDDLTHHMELLGWIKCQVAIILEKNNMHANICDNVLATIKNAEALFVLKKEFSMNLVFSEYQLNKIQILTDYVKELCKDFGETSDLDAICKTAFRLCDLLGIRRLQVMSLLIEHTKSADVLDYFKANEGKLNFTAEESKHIGELCSLTLNCVKLDTNTARTIKVLSGAALCNVPANQINDCVLPNTYAGFYYESFRHRHLASFHKKKDVSDSNWKLYPIYKDLAIGTDYLILPILLDTLSVQKIHVDRLRCGEEKLDISDSNKESQEELVNNIVNRMRTVKVEHNDYCLLQITNALYYGYCATKNASPSLLTEIRTIMIYFTKTLLKKVISARSFDLQLGLACLMMLPEQDAQKFIYSAHKSYKNDYSRYAISSILGSEYFRLLRNKNKEFVEFNYYRKIHHWTKQLSKCSVLYKEILPSDSIGQREILHRLLCSNAKNLIPIAEDFCTSFGFNITDCFLLYLETLVKMWTPTLAFTTSSGRKELQIPVAEVNEIRQKLTEVATKITDKDVLKEHITAMYKKMNLYYYELFIILMDLVEDKNTKMRNLISFLQNYTRVGRPTPEEYDEWLQLYPGHTSLPAIAKWRLPLAIQVDFYCFLKPELNFATYEKWLLIAPALKLDTNVICTFAVTGEIARIWGDINTKEKSEEWTLSPKNSSFSNDVKKCIGRMTGPDAEYFGITSLLFSLNHTPPGADLVIAARECYQFAQKCTTQERITAIIPKITIKYLRFSCEHILRTHGLGVNQYLVLIENPEKLIRDLYGDDSIPQRYRNVTDHRPDINGAVDALAELFTSINIIKIRQDLLHEWLQSDIAFMKLNSTFTEDFTAICSAKKNNNHDDNLLRMCYLLEHGNVELSTNFLINIGFGDSNKNYGPEARWRALQVLQSILDVDALENLTKRKLSTIRHYMRSLRYIGQLEALGLVYTMETFEACSKHELVQILWKTLYRSPQALSLIAYICNDFQIYEYALWDKILHSMAKFSMINELKIILLHLRNVSTITNSDGYLAGWQAIISDPFKAMDRQPSKEQIDNCLNVLRLLHSCPVSHMLQFLDIVNYCLQCQQPQLAVALLPFLNDADKEIVLQTVANDCMIEKLNKDLTQLELNGVLLISHSRSILQEALLKRSMPHEL